MNPLRQSLAIALALAVAGSGSLLAQRRTSDGGGSGGSRGTPSSGGSGGGSSSGGSRSGGSVSSPSRGGSSSASADSRRGGGSSTGGTATDARRGGSTASGGTTSSASGNRPARGKIGAIRDEAHAARSRGTTTSSGGGVFIGSCWGCNYWGWYGSSWGWYHGGWWYPSYYPPPDYYGPPSGGYGSSSEQGYGAYPYAGDSTGETFVQSRAPARRSYGAFTMQFFSDVGSTTKAGSVALEGAIGGLRGELEYSHYAEPVVGGTDHLHTLHLGIAAQPRIGNNAYLIAGVAARGIILDDGSHAWGPEGELGLQMFPVRPFGLNVTGRLAGLSWNGNDYFAFRELNTTGSVFISRVELQAGWHWMKLDGTPAFGGPVVGMRVWF